MGSNGPDGIFHACSGPPNEGGVEDIQSFVIGYRPDHSPPIPDTAPAESRRLHPTPEPRKDAGFPLGDFSGQGTEHRCFPKQHLLASRCSNDVLFRVVCRIVFVPNLCPNKVPPNKAPPPRIISPKCTLHKLNTSQLMYPFCRYWLWDQMKHAP